MKLTVEGAELSLPEGADAEISTEDRVTYVKIPLIWGGEPV